MNNEIQRRQRRMSPEENRRRKRRRKRRRILRLTVITIAAVFIFGLLGGSIKLVRFFYQTVIQKNNQEVIVFSPENPEPFAQRNPEWQKFYQADLELPELQVDLLTVNEYSRPGSELPEVNNIFIHYTANKGTSAEQNRSYFESLAETAERSASAHFVIGYDGNIVQCIPTKEIAYAVMKRNFDSISIECCYLDENGEFTVETYRSLIRLTAWLLHKYRLTPDDVLRHYDEGGKNCPKYYVENEEEWARFLRDLEKYMKSV